MARIPDKRALDGPALSRRPVVSIGGGAADGQGLARLGGALTEIGEDRRKDEDALDLIKADAKYKAGIYEAERNFDEDPDYKTFEPRFRDRATGITDDAASIIRNEKLREKWRLQTGSENEGRLNSVLRRGQKLKLDERQVEVENALKLHQTLYTDPKSDEGTRRQARADIEAAITAGEQNGVLEPKTAAVLRERYSRGSVIEDANTRLLTDPVGLRNDLTGAGANAKPQNDAIGRASQEAGVPDHLLRTFAKIESSGNPKARTGSYKGLFQLSDTEFEKHGGGDIYNADDNAMAAAKKIRAEAAEFESKYGREPSATDLYLIHQQGKGGYEAHMSNPELPAWMNMHSTAEGRQKGEAWSKLAIWGNVPDDVKEQFGDVENVTSADFIKLWDRKIQRIGGSGNVSPRYADLTPLERAEFAAKARRHETSALEGQREELKRALKDDEESIRRTGVSTNPDIMSAQKVLEPNQINTYVLNRRKAKMEYEAINDLSQLTDAGIANRLDNIEPKPGEADYDAKAEVYDKALKKATTLRELRENDPAQSVQDLPGVHQAIIDVQENPDNPEFTQRLAAARIEAQELVGVPPGLRSPITKGEARVLMSKVRGLEGKDLIDALVPLREQMETQYGQYARAAAVYAVNSIIRDKETSEVVGDVLEGAFRGMPVQASKVRQMQILNEAAAASRAFSGEDAAGDPGVQYGKDQQMQQGPMQADVMSQYGLRRPTQQSIDYLIANPATAAQFNRKYGGGMAEMFLTQGSAQ